MPCHRPDDRPGRRRRLPIPPAPALPAEATHVGWQRLGRGPWLALVWGATELEAHEHLLNTPFAGPTRDLTVLPRGRDPNVD